MMLFLTPKYNLKMLSYYLVAFIRAMGSSPNILDHPTKVRRRFSFQKVTCRPLNRLCW